MTEKLGFLASIKKRLRPRAIAEAVDTGHYLLLWTGVLIAHVVKVIMASAGVDPDVIRYVSWMEKWFWIGSFANFFWRMALHQWRMPRD